MFSSDAIFVGQTSCSLSHVCFRFGCCVGYLFFLFKILPNFFSKTLSTMKYAAFIATLLAGSASAFAPAQQQSRAATSLAAEKSQALPFMNRPSLVSVVVAKKTTICLGLV